MNKHNTLAAIVAEDAVNALLDEETATNEAAEADVSAFEIKTTIKNHQELVVIQNKELLTSVRHWVQYTMGYSEQLSRATSFPMWQLVRVRARFHQNREHPEFGVECRALNRFLKAREREMRKHSLERIGNGEVLFQDLPIVFEKGSEIVLRQGDDMVGGTVHSADIAYTMMGTFCVVHFKGLAAVASGVRVVVQKAAVPMFDGLVKVGDLNVRKPTDEEKAALTERGRKVAELVESNGYASYEGTVLREKWWNAQEYRASGRVMVDAKAFKMIDPDGYNDNVERKLGVEEDEDTEGGSKATEEALWSFIPYVYGFSFGAKAWGRMRVEQIRPINWRTNAFDRVVLPEDDKQLVRALVEHHGDTFEDIVEGKGGGLIFMLHGEPGQGKTLLAETTAEVLKRPLYMISVGELGTDPDQLEDRLRQILDLADTWNAVLLLDEADIFLEARDEKDIVRNAMVGVFLRLLEYHQGVLFLTTNRVKNIDRAFMSRISLALSFGNADQQKRKAIWNNLLIEADLDERFAQALSHYDLNGRQIKNVIRLTQTLAKGLGTAASMELFERVVSRVSAFTSDMKS